MAPLSLKIVLEGGAVTRTILFDSSAPVSAAYALIKEKLPTPDDGTEYGLFLTSADDENSGVWLEAHKPLENYMLRAGDCLHYLRSKRMLRVRMLDGAVKTMQVEEAKNVSSLMVGICGRIGITNHDEYGLCQEKPEVDEEPKEKSVIGTLTLKRKVQHREKDAKMEQLSKKLKTDDNVEWLDAHKTLRELNIAPDETLLLKRRLYFSDRNIDSRDPVQLNLLYLQTRNAILDGTHPVTESQENVDVQLIRLVKDHPVLYDYNNPKYMDFNAREVAWQKIGDALMQPAADCRVRWVNIRDVNRRIIRKLIHCPGIKMKPYKYEKEMAFMKAYYKDVVPLNSEEYDGEEDNETLNLNPNIVQVNYSDNDNNVDPIDPESDHEEKPLRKQKRIFKSNKKKAKRIKKSHSDDNADSEQETLFAESLPAPELDPGDSVDAFLISIGSTLKTFNPYHLNIAKSKIFAVVQEHDLKQIMQKDGEASPSNTTFSQ